MSRSGEIVRPFGGEDRTFRLGIGQWRQVQEACDAGPGEILERLSPAFRALKGGVAFADILAAGIVGRWRVDDIRVVLFHGLVGGGLAPDPAMGLVKAWVDERPLLEPLPLAYEVVYASIAGSEDEDAAVGEPTGETGPPLSPRGKLRFGRDGLYATGGAIGLSPRAVDALSLWELRAMAGGFKAANSPAKADAPLTREDVDRLGAVIRKPKR